MVYFRHRIDEKGIELIFGESIRVNSDDLSGKGDKTAFIDSTVQVKNITYPTDSKLHRKIIRKYLQISRKESLPLRQSYSRTLKDLSLNQRFRNYHKKALRADKEVKVIVGRLVQESERNTGEDRVGYASQIWLFNRVLSRRSNSKDREHKKYEFGNMAFVITSIRGVIPGALSFRNEYDSHTVNRVLEQVKRITGMMPDLSACDRGYRGQKQSGNTGIELPEMPKLRDTRCRKHEKRNLFCKWATVYTQFWLFANLRIRTGTYTQK